VTHRILASTTSHKREALAATLEAFARLGLRDVDLNLHHILEGGEAVETVAAITARNGQHIRVVSGGWCDFFHGPPKIDETFRSVDRQVRIASQLHAAIIRLFFGRLAAASCDSAARSTIVANLRRLSDRHPDTAFVFENHDGASLVPDICRDVLGTVDRSNIRMNFDPINFARAGVDPAQAMNAVEPWVAHMHLKGIDNGEFCEFGKGDVDLTPLLRRLIERGYSGDFTVEYEGPFDGTLRLYESVERARKVAAALTVGMGK
jgi:sugar phosphate isomerase/epimerase